MSPLDKSNVRIVGSPEPCECQPVIYLSRTSGNGFTRRFKALNWQLASLASALRSQGADTVTTNPNDEGPVGSAEATFSRDPTIPQEEEQAQVVYELRFEPASISIHHAEYYHSIPQTRWDAIMELAQVLQSETDTTAREQKKAALNMSTREAEALASILSGTSEYEVTAPVLVFRSTVTQAFAGQVGVAEQDKIFTTDQISAIYNVPSWYVIPESIASAKAPAGWLAGWKKGVEVNGLSNGNAELTEMYRFKVWDMRLHVPA